MNVYKIATAGGIDKALAVAIEGDLEGKGGVARAKSVSLDELDSVDPELGRIARALWREVSK
jgi:hypothetical protein